jgi:hypothetical protein
VIREVRRPLNLKRFSTGDIVSQYRSGALYRISGPRWRSECLDVVNLHTGVAEIRHPREFDPVENPLLLLAAQFVE